MTTPLTILEGSTFCICDEKGDVGFHEPSGFFTSDTRFLSIFRLTLNGDRPLMLSSGKVDYFSAAFYLRNPMVGDLPQDCLSIVRERFVGDGMQDTIRIQNQSMGPLSFEVGLEVGCDFADIMSVKERDFFLGDPLNATPLPPLGAVHFDEDESRFVIVDSAASNGSGARTQVILSQPGAVDGSTISFAVTLAPRETWTLGIDIVPSLDGAVLARHAVEQRFGEERTRVRESLSAWQLRVPQLRASWEHLQSAFQQSVADLASLRMRSGSRGIALLPAAGMPWFMTVFGRDTLITCLQTLLFGPELAHSALEVLAELQSTEDDPSIDAEPGKIVHEIRRGKTARIWTDRYYGTVDATPLWVCLLADAREAGLHDDEVLPLLPHLEAALGWMRDFGDTDGDGLLEYVDATGRGLSNQGWKDSGDSVQWRDGRLAEGPIALCEVQGYAYEAAVRGGAILRDFGLDGDEWTEWGARLAARFRESFWIPDAAGAYPAVALDASKRPVDTLTSNIGHLLGTGLLDAPERSLVARRLVSPELNSGFGLRTMSTDSAGYWPLSYHGGSVWTHDTAIAILGLTRDGFRREAAELSEGLLRAAVAFDYRMPELHGGDAATDAPRPVPYPAACRPQAWSAAAAIAVWDALP